MVFVIGLNHEYGEYVMQEAFGPNTPQKNDLLYTEFVNSDSDPVSLWYTLITLTYLASRTVFARVWFVSVLLKHSFTACVVISFFFL